MSNLNVRINHKYDTYARWMQSTIVLGKGEIAVCEIPASQEFNEPEGSSRLTPPAIGVKIGDGSKTFAQLPWIQSTAGDVYAWAKAATKPSYTASEIGGLEDFIAGEIQDTDTTYQFSYEGGVLTVKSKLKGEETFNTTELTLDLTVKMDKVAGATAGNLAAFTADGSVADSGEKIGDFMKTATAEATYAKQADFDVLEGTVGDHETRLGTAEGKLTTLIGSDAGKSARAIAAEELAAQLVKEGAAEALDTLEEIAAWIQQHPEDAAAMSKDIEALKTAVGKAAEGETAGSGLIADVDALEAAVDALEGKAHEHANKDILDGIDADRVAAWDGAEAAAKGYADGIVATEKGLREAADSALDGRLTTVEGLVGKTATEGLRATAADHETRIAEVEAKKHEHENKDVLDAIADTDIAAARSAVQSITGVVTEKTGTAVAVTSVPVTLLRNVADDTLTFECGDSGVPA